MRLLKRGTRGEVSLTRDLINNIPVYAILSHTWGEDDDEVTFDNVEKGLADGKRGYEKIRFCGNQAHQDGLQHFWVDTCCINKANHVELSAAITSMFRWYHGAAKCYVYLADVSADGDHGEQAQQRWESAFRNSRWFARGWTLQELLAPASVEFFSREGTRLGSKKSLEALIQDITQIPTTALRGQPLCQFSFDERWRWAAGRNTKNIEDKAYCLLGIFDVSMCLRYGEGEREFKRLKDKVQNQQDSPLSPIHKHWMVTRPTNPLFIGRRDVLQDLDYLISNHLNKPPDQEQCRIVISGMGGQGKSEICLQLAHRHRQRFWGVFWIDVSSVAQAERSFLDVARKLFLPAQNLEDARIGIANLKHPSLLVLDNADDPRIDYLQYFPDGPLGVVILTSRNEDCQQYATVKSIVLEGLADDEARELLLKAARVPQAQHAMLDNEARAVASLLRFHPLALIQAGAYVSRGHCTLAHYPMVYAQKRRRLLQFRPTQARSRYGDLYATFEASADILMTSETGAAQDALQLLPLLAVCGPSRLPLRLFEAGWNGAKRVPADLDDDADDEKVLLLTPWHVAHLPSLLDCQLDSWDSSRLVEAVQLLKEFSLVSADCQGGHLSVWIHPLICAWGWDRQDDQKRHQGWLQMACVVAFSKGRRDTLEATWATASTTRGDVRLKRSKVEREWMGIYDLVARNLVMYGAAKQAIVLLTQLVSARELYLAQDHQDRLASQHALAGAYRANGQVKEAVGLLEQVVKIREQRLGEDHPSRLASQHELAGAYRANGQVKEAVVLLERVVNIEQQTLAEDHPSRLASQHELAGAYCANGQVKEAVVLLERVVNIEQQALADDHPSRLASLHNLAVYRWELGNYQASYDLMAKVVQIHRQVLDETHPDRQTSEGWLETFENEIAKLERA